MEDQTTGLIVKPAIQTKDAVSDLKAFEDLKANLLSTSDYQTIQSKNFIKKSGWRKLALVFNVSDSITEEKYEPREDGSFLYSFKVRATAPNGRYTEAVASCDSRERKFSHPLHDVRATAHTRAKSRAISDLIGAGEVSAEEMEAEDHSVENARNITPAKDEKPLESKPLESQDAKISLKLDSPLADNQAPFSSFFLGRILPGMKEKHSDFRFELVKKDGLVSEILVSNASEEMQKEIKSTLDWSVKRTLEKSRGA